MKLTKADFKSIIKECITELIKDGSFNEVLRESMQDLGNTPLPAAAPKRKSAQDLLTANPVNSAMARAAAARMTGYDDYNVPGMNSDDLSEMTNMPVNQNVLKLVETTAAQISKGDSKSANAYAAILADTAMNTLPQQMAQDPSRGGGYGALAAAGMQGHQEKVAPQELQAIAPSGDMSHWAKLAFGKYNK
jgi:hypothetical protein